MSIAGQLSSESLATTTTTSRPIVIERPHETTKRIAKERIAEKKETKQRFLERYDHSDHLQHGLAAAVLLTTIVRKQYSAFQI